MKTKPNILFILTDQQNSQMMSCAGNPGLRTPAMDRIAAEGVRFDRAYCTNPVCVASRFSLMTGHMPGQIGLFSNHTSDLKGIPDSIQNNGLGHLMARVGYEAAYGGKVHLPRMTAESVGFNYICKDERDQLAGVCADFIRGRHDKPFFLVASFINPHDICYMAIRDFAQTESETGIVLNGAVECATLDQSLVRPEGLDEDSFFAEHCPSLPPNFEPQQDEPEAIRIMMNQRPFRANVRANWSERRWREHRWAYARLTETVDRQIARLLEALEESGRSDNTVVIFTSDHGDMDTSHRMEHKSAFYDQACRIPLIIRPPGGTTPRVDSTHLVSNGLDILPTCCDWAGIAAPRELPGKSLRGLAESNTVQSWRESLPLECAMGRAVITRRFKYCRYDIGTSSEQLIDLDSDPLETRNAIHEHGGAAIEKLSRLFEDNFAGAGCRSTSILKDLAQA